MGETVIENSCTGALVLYSSSSLQTNQVQKLAPISEVIIENRVVGEGELFCATISNIKISPDRVICEVEISHFVKKPHPESEKAEGVPLTLIQALRKKIFKPDIAGVLSVFPTITVGDDKYILDWKQKFGKNQVISISYYDKTPMFNVNLIGEIKTEFANEVGILLSNSLLISLFNPISGSLITLYRDIARF